MLALGNIFYITALITIRKMTTITINMRKAEIPAVSAQ
jgi:hypothetical protein